MASSVVSSVGRALRWLWWLLDASRRTLLNLLFLLLLVGLVWLLVRPGTAALQPKTALLLNLAGPVNEQRSGNARDSALQRLRGDDESQTQLRDVLAVLDNAAKDPNVAHAVLLLDDFVGGGMPTLREVAAGIERFKAAGKPVYAWGSSYDQRAYYLAAHATEVWLHPMGGVGIEGFGRYRNYYKDAFDRFGITANVLRVGRFKNAGETFSANAPSKETLESESFLMDALWSAWTGGVERARKLPAGSMMKNIDALPASLLAVGGDSAKLALQEKLVDGLKTRDEMRALMIERGARDEDNKTFRQVSFGEYLARIKPRQTGDAVGVVVAEGTISDGQAPGGNVGGLSTSALIRQAREDEKIKALVLRVDSPGGSAFGSELVRRELELTRAAGKPVVVSMGDLAASGGYWISLAADEVIADETTITGSIGVVAILPNAQGALDKVGLRTGGYTTTWLTDAVDPRRALDPRVATLVQASIDHVYSDFTGHAAEARKTTRQKIDEVGQGRVWTGQQALERGLVDRTGSYVDALAAAAKRAKLTDGYRVQYLDRAP
ncbi:MAG: signal peptide peptidase SppA, partial [Chitinophagaceae bacterium]|nr:signal peptide peptidase SppA [Rubrivivax sp.]